MSFGWNNTSIISKHEWTCGYCGKVVGGNVGYYEEQKNEPRQRIYICPTCERPTAFVRDEDGVLRQFPEAVYGNDVEDLPSDVRILYAEVRRCVQYTAYTAAVLAMRKLLMHVAVSLGAEENRKFAEYVNYLDDNHYITPNAKAWVEPLRKYGNEATHQIVIMDEEKAAQLLDFAEMLLKIVYEFPAKIRKQ